MRCAGCTRLRASAIRFPISKARCLSRNLSSKKRMIATQNLAAKIPAMRAGKRGTPIPRFRMPRAQNLPLRISIAARRGATRACRWPSFSGLRRRPICSTIPASGRRVSAGNIFWLCTMPRGSTPPHEVLTMCRRFFRLASRAHSDAGWRASAGCAIRGPAFRDGFRSEARCSSTNREHRLFIP